jgi:hypothetical protein
MAVERFVIGFLLFSHNTDQCLSLLIPKFFRKKGVFQALIVAIFNKYQIKGSLYWVERSHGVTISFHTLLIFV